MPSCEGSGNWEQKLLYSPDNLLFYVSIWSKLYCVFIKDGEIPLILIFTKP